MDYKKIILNKLLDKYEKSKSYVKSTNRRIMVKVEEIKEYDLENYEQKLLFHETLKELKLKKIVDFNYLKYEEGNILDKIWLEKENIVNAYIEAQRENPKENYVVILERLESENFKQEWLRNFCEHIKNYMLENQKECQLLSFGQFEDILKALEEIDKMQSINNAGTILKRIFSINCYNDSKYFEKNIEKNIIGIVKKFYFEENGDIELKDDDILKEVGIIKYPEIIEFCGNMRCTVKGKIIEFSDTTEGSYINGNAILNLENVELIAVDKIIWIENKANYIDYILNKKPNEFVIYHGGFYSPIKGNFFKKIYEASTKLLNHITYLHWSDIDIGGFEIFTRLKDNVAREVEPYKMDNDTLVKYKYKWSYFNEKYKDRLYKLRNCEKYCMFFDVIDTMIEHNCKLEQESIIS